MSKGKIKEYNTNQGYGTIVDSSSGQTLTVYANYVHLLTGEILTIGQDVEYEIENQRNGSWAVNVRIAHVN